MKTTKREHRRPDMQIYRPRMSLQNKNFKIEDHCVTSDKNDLLEHSKYQSSLNNLQVNTLHEHTDRTTNLISDVSKTSKYVKNRRPDIQIYVPKPKLVAHLNEKKFDSRVNGSETGLKNDVQSESSSGKMSSLTPNVNEVQISSKKTHSELASKHFSTKHSESNSSVRTKYWAALVEDSDFIPPPVPCPVSSLTPNVNEVQISSKRTHSELASKQISTKHSESNSSLGTEYWADLVQDSDFIPPPVPCPVSSLTPNVNEVQISSKKTHSELASKQISTKHSESNSSLGTEYWADLVQDSDFIPPPVPCPVPDYFIATPAPCPVQDYFSAPPVPCEVPDDFIPPPVVPFPDIYLRNYLPEPGKKRLKPIVEKNLANISILEKELSFLLAEGFDGTNFNAAKLCRYKLQLHYESIFLADLKYCAERNPEQCLWMSVFYQIIEYLRNKLDEDKEETLTNLLKVISESTIFYENLIEKQQETFGFNLASILKDSKDINSMPEELSLVLISTQKLLICLGDLARYKEEACQTAYYGKARSWYNKAQQIGPESGIPYYQLAALALKTGRKLDVAYYYIKSLTASYPILSAKEDLLSLFEEAKRKFEQYEKKPKPETPYELKVLDEKITMCHEVWIKPEGSSNQQPTEVDLDSSDVKYLSDVELNKRFITSFMHVHGKLFANVGMENFSDTLTIMLDNFYNLIQRSPLPITSSRLLQILTINMFSVENSSKENNLDGSTSLLHDQASNVSMLMMFLLTSRCQKLESMNKLSPESSNQISDDLDQMLSCKKIWISCLKSFV